MTGFDDKIGACKHVCLAIMLWVHMQDYRGGSEVLQCQVPRSIVERELSKMVHDGSHVAASNLLSSFWRWPVHEWSLLYTRGISAYITSFWIPREEQTVWWSIASIWIVPSTSTLVMVQLMSKVENYQPKVACDRRKKEKKNCIGGRWKSGSFDACKSWKWVGC